MMGVDLSGKTALVTGGGQGLGAATVKALVHAGARVAINYFNDAQGLNRARAGETAASFGAQAISVEADVRDAAAVARMFDEVIAWTGRVDLVVNNAGVLRDRTIKKMSQEDWDGVIATNLTGVFNVCREAALKLADDGRIVNLSSISGCLGFFGQANYAASKAGVIGLTKVLSRELAKRRITVNAIAPGVILTEMGQSIPDDVRAEMLKNVPLARFGKPEEIANTVLFLCSEWAGYITGQVIHVNGGWI